MALRQHNEMVVNVVRQLCRGAGAARRAPLTGRGSGSPGDQSPGSRSPGTSPGGPTVLSAVNDILMARVPFDRLRASTVRSKMLQYLRFQPLLNDGADPECPWPVEDPYLRYGAETFAQDAMPIWFEPLPPMLPNLEQNPKLPPAKFSDAYTLVLDLDETLVHYYECDGMGNYDIRPGMHEFLERMSSQGYELVIFTAATQDYADWVIDQIDPGRLMHHRLYRQHALPWGPIFVKDLSRLGRDLDRTLIIDNVQENFMLQPHNGIFICTWYDDPHDTALFALTPLLDELHATRAKVPEILDKYRDQIPTWAGFDYSQLGPDYSEFDVGVDEGPPPPEPAAATPSYPGGGSLSSQPIEQAAAAPLPYAAEVAPPQPQPRQPLQMQPPQQPLQPTPQLPPQTRPQHPQTQQSPVDNHAERRSQSNDEHRVQVGSYPVAQAPQALGDPMPSTGAGTSPAAYAGRYQPLTTGTAPGLQPAGTRGGYPQPQAYAPTSQQDVVREVQKAQPRQALPFQASGIAGPYQAAPPQSAPRTATFSATGISGPYQAAAPSPPLPTKPAMWSHTSHTGVIARQR